MDEGKLTFREAVASDRLEDFIRQEVTHGVELSKGLFRKAKPACDCGFAQRSFDGAVMITNVRSHSPVIGLRQFSHNPAKPKGGFFEWRAN